MTSKEHKPHSSLTVAGAKAAIQDALTWALDEHDYSGTENPQEYVRGALIALDGLLEQYEYVSSIIVDSGTKLGDLIAERDGLKEQFEFYERALKVIAEDRSPVPAPMIAQGALSNPATEPLVTGENLAARVQQAQHLLDKGDEVEIVAWMLGRDVEDVRRVVSPPAKKREERDSLKEQLEQAQITAGAEAQVANEEHARAEGLLEQLEAVQEERLTWEVTARANGDDYQRLKEQYEDAQRKLSCGYETGTGRNCGECLDCLKVNWYFVQEAMGNLKEQYEGEKARADRNQEHLNVERDANAKTVKWLNEQLQTAQQEAVDMQRAASGMSADVSVLGRENEELKEQLEALRDAAQRYRDARSEYVIQYAGEIPAYTEREKAGIALDAIIVASIPASRQGGSES